ncbi:hypothetical protein [Clostridium sp.]|nr:hypothetical protein [Clostridium sp.]
MLKVNKNRLYNLIIIFILFLNSLCFFIPSLMNMVIKLNTYHNKILIFLIVLTSLLMLFIIKKDKTLKLGSVDWIIITFILMITIILLIQITTTNEMYYELISNCYYLYIILLFYLLKNSFKNRLDSLINIILIVGFIYTISNIIIYLLVKLGVYYNSYPLIQYVNGNLRLPQSADIIGFTCVLFSYNYIYKARKIKYLVGTIITFLTVLLVSQVRMSLLAIGITIIIMLIQEFRYYKRGFLYFVFCIAILMAGFILVTKFGITKNSILDVFIGEGQKQASALYRIIEIKHYSKYFFENYLFGFGFTNNPDIIVYSLTDIGVFGFIFKFGLLGLIWLIFLVKYFLKSLKASRNKVLTIGCITYFSFTFISLSMFDSQRIVLLPLLLFLIYESNKNNYIVVGSK